MKILQVNKYYYPWLGGVETTVANIAEGLAKEPGFISEVLVCNDRRARVVETRAGVKIYRAKSFGHLFGMPLSFDFFRLFRRLAKDYDVIIMHHPFPLAFAAYALFGKRARLIVLYHSDIVKQKITKWFFQPFLINCLKRADKIIATSQSLLKNSPVLRRFSAKGVVVYTGPLDLDKFAETPEIAVAAQKIREEMGGPFALAVGRLVYYKGFEYLLAAMKDVNYKALIIGAGPLEAKLKKMIVEFNLGNRIKIIPPVPDLPPYYYASDFFVFPSCAPSEAFGLVQAEAMACGRAVINTDLGTGVPEVSLDGATGLTVPPKDPAALAAAMNELFVDPALREKFGQAGKIRAEEYFTKKQMIEHLLEIIA